MIIVNFGPPLFPAHLRQIQHLVGEAVEQVIDVEVPAVNEDRPFLPQVLSLLDRAGLEPDQWQCGTILLHLPRAGDVAATILALAASRMRRFPTLVRAKPYGAVEVDDLHSTADPSPHAV